tara:strand:+ start:255 stop:536 length:282 start_codon:yes stop_codon:yes gene_type:complete
MSKKKQIEDSLDEFIEKSKAKYNGIIPMRDLEFTVNGCVYTYSSVYYSTWYEDHVCSRYIKKNFICERVRDLSKEEYERLPFYMHGNLLVMVL